jgi:hypothetical protein
MDRVELIRKGNQEFNLLREEWSWETLKRATELFSAAQYQDGLLRVADYLYFERKLPLLAVSYYKKAGSQMAQKRIYEIRNRMTLAIKFLMRKVGDKEFDPETLKKPPHEDTGAAGGGAPEMNEGP